MTAQMRCRLLRCTASALQDAIVHDLERRSEERVNAIRTFVATDATPASLRIQLRKVEAAAALLQLILLVYMQRVRPEDSC